MGWRWRIRVLSGVLALWLPLAAEAAVLDAAARGTLAGLPALKGFGVEAGEMADRPVIVVFFASWCVPCRQGFVELRQVVEAAPDVKVVALNWLEDVTRYPAEDGRLQRMIDRVAPGIAVLEGSAAASAVFGEVGALPAVFAFGADGRPVFEFVYGGTGPQVHPTAAMLLEALGGE